MARKHILIAVVVVAIAACAATYYARSTTPNPEVTTQPISRGDILETVAATGTVEAVTTVQVGTQVSGTVQALYADFNSLVRKGQVLARLDPSLFQTQVEQSRANLVRSEADADRLDVAVRDARAKLQRARELSARQLIPAAELETAEVTLRSAEAQLQSAAAQITQARAALRQAEVSLDKTVITAPIDGIVVARNVDVGQTVAASLQAPTLYVITADLTRMRVNASIDEADVGRIRPSQNVRFRVDAFPAEEFSGAVSQVRLSPVVVQNVVTYTVVIDVPNPELKLKPGMTATVTIRIAEREDVLRIPNAALRFRPTAEIFAALGQTPPQTPAGGAVNADNRWRQQRDGRVAVATRGTVPGRVVAGEAQTVDALFGPLAASESVGRVWMMREGRLQPIRVRLGLSDETQTELLDSDLREGSLVVINVLLPGDATEARSAGPSNSANPLMPSPRRPGMGGGRR
jgi:HlyD family secretion protein